MEFELPGITMTFDEVTKMKKNIMEALNLFNIN